MEAELELMMVGAWIQGDRTKLLMRVESMERELQLLSSERTLQREACEAQKERFARRAMRQEMLRRICERRTQDLERQVMLLSEQLRVSEEALQRERTSTHTCTRRCLKRSASSERTREGVPAPAPALAQHGPHRHQKPAESDCVREFQSNAHVPTTEPGHKHAATIGVAPTHDPVPITSESLRDKRSGRKVARDRGNAEKHQGCGDHDDGKTIDLDMALSKIQALAGMVRAQEEIEKLLTQELEELRSNQPGNRESLWRPLTKCSNCGNLPDRRETRDFYSSP